MEHLAFLWAFLAHDLIVLVLVPIVLIRHKEPSATIAWIFAILLMPFLGAIGFLAFGNDRLARRARKRGIVKQRIVCQEIDFAAHRASPASVRIQVQLWNLLKSASPYHAHSGNRVKLYFDMHENYDEQIAAINAAETHIHIEYYIFETDRSGRRFQEALIAAAKRGVTVRFLYDAVGSMHLKQGFLSEMEEAGIATACFIPFTVLTRRWIFNFRTHRKILVVDGTVGFTGGSNIGNEYLGESEIGTWQDLHLKLEGPAVPQLQRVFIEDWAFATGEEVSISEHCFEVAPCGTSICQVVPGGPDMKVAVYQELYFAAIANATERIYVATPYFVPDNSIMMALQTAARRGVDVRVFVPGKSTHHIVQFAAESYYETLMSAGVKIYEFGGGFLHAKVMTVDGGWSIVGTANLDNRSMKLNFEIGVAFYDSSITENLESFFVDLASRSTQVQLKTWRRRSMFKRIAENSSRLFSPIL